jgi:hypothetical protein
VLPITIHQTLPLHIMLNSLNAQLQLKPLLLKCDTTVNTMQWFCLLSYALLHHQGCTEAR